MRHWLIVCKSCNIKLKFSITIISKPRVITMDENDSAVLYFSLFTIWVCRRIKSMLLHKSEVHICICEDESFWVIARDSVTLEMKFFSYTKIHPFRNINAKFFFLFSFIQLSIHRVSLVRAFCLAIIIGSVRRRDVNRYKGHFMSLYQIDLND